MTARQSFSTIMVLAATVAAGCADSTGPAEQDANGVWTGSLTHPSYDGGSLRLTLTDANGVVEGTYRLILSKQVGGRVSVQQSGGNVSGSSANGRLTLRLQRSDRSEWLLEGQLRGSNAAGDWSTERRLRGSFDVSR